MFIRASRAHMMMDYFRRLYPDVDVFEVEVLSASDIDLLNICRLLGLGLNLDELKHVKAYFSKIGRNPTDVELQTISQVWSEHCFHKTFKGVVKLPDGSEIRNMLKTYIAKVLDELHPSWVISAFEDNAGIVEFDEDYGIAVKVETHNHPSAIEPFGGAATGVGGVIRDVLGVWADPIALIDVLGFGPLNYPEDRLPRGIKHPRLIYRGVVSGIAHYGNNMGIPTVAGAVIFEEGYVGNVVVYCGCVGILPKNKYIRKVREGDYLIVAGNRTGRDGLHGVVFASAELTEESEEAHRSAVQIPDPVVEESLRRAIARIRDEELAHGITDLGGGGLSCAVCETAHRYGLGAVVWLHKLHLRDPTLRPWEIWLSESQERMLIVAPPRFIHRIIEIFREEELPFSIVGRVVSSGKVEVYYRKYLVCNLDLDFLFNPPITIRYAEPRRAILEEPNIPEPDDYGQTILDLLSSPNICSREDVVRTYDFEVGGRTVIKPLHGWYGGHSDGVIIKPLPHSWRGVVISVGVKPRYSKISTFWMAASSIDEAIRNNVAAGGRRIALLDNFTWGSPEKPDRMWDLVEAVKACYEFARYFETPFISGKDSLYNESPLGPVTPTLLITAIGIIPDIRKAVSIDFKKNNNYIVIIGLTRKELGGSEYYALRGVLGSSVPKVYKDTAKRIVETIVKLIDEELIVSCHDVSDGGVAVTIAEMVIAGRLGAEVDVRKIPYEGEFRPDYVLFSESNTRFIVEVPEDNLSRVLQILKDVPHAVIGRVIREPRLVVKNGDNILADLGIGELDSAWRRPCFEKYFRYC
ncbi:MAG: phosphoribosylformylglycinamidine synthase subunit PurL [Crenarchaeota archaeon]|nr:phosphoribosylformylglycinamidine synthase subunit PurL [Thermoproteota archaeon]